MYNIINVEQGTQEWHDLRAKFYKTASRTPSVMDSNPFMSKEQLAMNLRGEYEPFYSKAMRQGNELEDKVREQANILLDDLFMPMVGEDGNFLASLDGINFNRDTIIEIKVSEKTFNDIQNDTIPLNYMHQIIHQMMVFDSVEIAYLIAYNPKTEEIAISNPINKNVTLENKIIKAWQEFDLVKDTLKVNEFDMSDNKRFNKAVEEFKSCKLEADKINEKLSEAKNKLYAFYQGGKTFGNGVTISYSKPSKSIKYADIYKQNKDKLKDIDMTKYESEKAGSYKITVKSE